MKSKKSIILLSGIILTLVLTLSISYAFFYYVEEGDEITLTSGSISINFSEGTNYISLGNSYPKSDIMGKIDPNYYDFTVSGSKGENDDILYEIQIEPEEGNTLDEKYVKVYLTDQNNEYVTPNPKKVSELKISEHNGKRVIYDKFINKVNESNNYRLRVWIDESYTENVSKTFSFKVKLYSANAKAEFIYDQIAKLNGTNGVVAINTDGDLASSDDEIREYRYSGNARYCTYAYNESIYKLNVDLDTCPDACYTSSKLFRYDSDYLSKTGSCNIKLQPNETTPLTGEVKNYIWFNNEMWRIIGAFDETTADGTTQHLLKIMREEPLLYNEVPDTYINTFKGGFLKYANVFFSRDEQVNDWTIAQLQLFLNDNTEIGYYNSVFNEYKDMIEQVIYHLGTVKFNYNIKNFYNAERTGNSNGYPETWLGKIGLLYPSDYLYASNSLYWSNSSKKYLENWIDSKVPDDRWTISPVSNSGFESIIIDSTGHLDENFTDKYGKMSNVSPVLYLKSNIRILDGDGSYNNPYQIGW